MIIPVRGIADKGIISDYDGYNLGLDSLTMGVNVRCEDGSVSRGPVARQAGALPKAPRHSLSYEDGSGATQAHVVARDGSVCLWQPSGTTDLTPAGYVLSDSDAVVTSCISNGVMYISREDHQLIYKTKNAPGPYKLLSSYDSGNHGAQYSANLRFRALRSTAGILVGINVTDNGINYPTKIKWSTTATSYGLPPDDWDVGGIIFDAGGEEIGSSLGGENVLADMTGELRDGLALANNLVLYGSLETWLMEYVGVGQVFNFRRLFQSGVLNTNCVVEREGVHYVFGEDGDIYMHDGTGQRKSLAVNRVKQFVNKSMVLAENHQAFVFHNRLLNEILFCYVSTDQYCAFPYSGGGPKGCNRAAVYNYQANTWYFYDLPYVNSATIGPVATGLDYSHASSTYQTAGGSYSSQGEVRTVMLMTSPAFKSSGPAMRSFGIYSSAATTGNLDLDANGPVIIEKTKMDLDQLTSQNPFANIQGTKLISGLNIECDLASNAKPIDVSVGASMHPSQIVTWEPSQTFDQQHLRIDCNLVGRILGIRMIYNDTPTFTLSGYDMDVTVLGGR